MSAKDNLQFILNAAQFGLLMASGGNSHNTTVLGLSNFIPAFVPSTLEETERVLQIASSKILNGEDGRCLIATGRFKIGEFALEGETLLDAATVDEIRSMVIAKWAD